MPMPRRRGYSVAVSTISSVPQNTAKCVIVAHVLDLGTSNDRTEDGFDSLNDAMKALDVDSSEKNKALEAMVESHPLFSQATKEYESLLNIFLPGCFELDANSQIGPDSLDCGASDVPEDPELTEALTTFISLTRRRKQKANEFYATLAQFLEEYEKAVDELTSISADPILKGSYLHEKISELKSTVKRKYGSKVQELQKECINKRRRANLPDSAVEIFRQWFAQHRDNPYPSDLEKQHLAQITGVAEAQVSNWFVNVRKRYWKSR